MQRSGRHCGEASLCTCALQLCIVELYAGRHRAWSSWEAVCAIGVYAGEFQLYRTLCGSACVLLSTSGPDNSTSYTRMYRSICI